MFDRFISKNAKDVDNDSLVMHINNCKSQEELKSDEVKTSQLAGDWGSIARKIRELEKKMCVLNLCALRIEMMKAIRIIYEEQC